jgi:hypothetical protein
MSSSYSIGSSYFSYYARNDREGAIVAAGRILGKGRKREHGEEDEVTQKRTHIETG